ncbi:hypothetical protein [Cupriavidus campinensis]
MPAVKFSPFGNTQTVNATGAPANGWKIYTYQAGSSTPLAAYTDSTGNVAQSNPIIINSLGFPTNGQIWLQSGVSYKLVLTDASDVVQKTEDNISGINDTTSSVSEWVTGPTPTYINATSFSLAGDQRQTFITGRRLRFSVSAGTVYGTVITSVYNGSSLTTVTIGGGEGPLDSGLSSVSYGFLSPSPTSVPWLPITAYGVRGLTGLNNATTPNTKYDLSAEAAVFFNQTTGGTVVLQNITTITNDLTVQGVNGRDQVAAFTASNWIHYYFIYNGTNKATIASLAPPVNGPNLATALGYTHWCYAGAVFYNATPLLVKTRMKGCMAFYEFPSAVLTNGNATVETPVVLSSAIPPNAISTIIAVQTFNMTSDGSGNAFANAFIRVVSGFNFALVSRIAIASIATVGQGAGGGSFEVPNIGQQIYYIIQVLNGSAQSLTLYLNGYKMPNGDS